MRLIEKEDIYTGNKFLTGKKKNYRVNIYFSASTYIDRNRYWHYIILKDDENYRYSSLQDDLMYLTQEKCVIACEEKIDKLIEEKRKMKT